MPTAVEPDPDASDAEERKGVVHDVPTRAMRRRGNRRIQVAALAEVKHDPAVDLANAPIADNEDR